MKKKIVAASILSVAMCASVITGATYALFTSESQTNIAIQAGTVNVTARVGALTVESAKLVSFDGTVVNDEYVVADDGKTFVNGGTAFVDENVLTVSNMTPGDRVSFPLVIENKSNVNIQYQSVVAIAKDDALFDGLIVTIDGEQFDGITAKTDWKAVEPVVNGLDNIDDVMVTVELPADAGNEYQGASTEIVISVTAVQGNTDTEQKPLVYDQAGEYALNLSQYGNISANGSDGAIRVMQGTTLTLDGAATVNGEMGADGYAMAVWANGGTVVINGGNYTQEVTGNDSQYDLIYASNGGNIVINGGTFKSVTPAWTLNVKDADRATSHITVNGGKFYGLDFEELITGEDEISLPVDYTIKKDGEWNEIIANVYKNEAGEYVINNVNGLQWLAKTVNEGNDFAGETVKLDASLDLTDVEWTAISSFAGTFDGQGYTISNLKNASLFGSIAEAGVVKKLNLKDVSREGALGIGGFLANSLNGKAEYCTVKNATATSTLYGFSGMFGYSGVTAVIDHCSVDNYTLTVTNTEDNRDKVGGLVGQSSGTTITNSSVSNITLNGVTKTKEWGGFVGRHANEGLVDGCTATNVTINVSNYAQSVGGFVGVTGNATIQNCSVTTVVLNVNKDGFIGGFCGATEGAKYYDFYDCKVSGLSITLKEDTVSGIGGFCGRAAYTLTIKNSSVEGVIHASETAIAGGRIKALVGYDRVDQYPDIMVTEGNVLNVTIG